MDARFRALLLKAAPKEADTSYADDLIAILVREIRTKNEYNGLLEDADSADDFASRYEQPVCLLPQGLLTTSPP